MQETQTPGPYVGISAQGSPDICCFVSPEYFDFCTMAGAVPRIIYPVSTFEEALEAISGIDGLLLSGGNDVDPALYGAKELDDPQEAVRHRDESELLLIKAALMRDLPIFGICRGIQILNVALGGTLEQDLPGDGAGLAHFTPGRIDAPQYHDVEVADELFASRSGLSLGRHRVNSLHHQAVKTASDGATIGAFAPDGSPEALFLPAKPYAVAVQWHPELSLETPESKALAEGFGMAMGAYRDSRECPLPCTQPNREGIKLNNEYLRYMYEAGGDEEGRRKCRAYMEQSTAVYRGNVIYSSYFPKIFDRVTWDRLGEIADTTYGILKKVIDRYLADEDYRRVFDYDPRMVELICLPRRYDSTLPFARIDLFLDEETLEARFCEFNADGSSGMNENRETTNSILGTLPYQRLCENHRVQDINDTVFIGWVREFLRIYRSYHKAVENPHVAILDYLQNSVIEEFKIYRELFAQEGVELSIYDIRDVRYENGALVGYKPFAGRDGARIDAVWRRCVSNDVLEFWDESQDFIAAVKDDAFALIGSFAGHIVHDKQIFKALLDPRTRAFLTPDECAFIDATIPYTQFLDSTLVDADAIKADPWNWIIKPTDGYGCKDVFPGPRYMDDRAEWARIIDGHINGKSGVPFLAQRYCHPYKTPAVPLYQRDEDFTGPVQYFNNLEGLYLIDGKFSGVFSRLGPNPLILGREGGVTAPTLMVDLCGE